MYYGLNLNKSISESKHTQKNQKKCQIIFKQFMKNVVVLEYCARFYAKKQL